MLLSLLFAMIFGSSGESEFITEIPNFEKEVKHYVRDAGRRDSLLLLIDEYETAIKDYGKEKKKLQKNLDKVSADRSVGAEELLKHYDDYYQIRTKLISSLIDYRILFQQKITQEELLRVIEGAIVVSDDLRRETQLREEKTENQLNQAFSQINDILAENIADKSRAEAVATSFFEFERTMYDYVDIAKDTDGDRVAMLLNINATHEELAGIYERSNQVRFKAARDFVILREAVIMNTNMKEWKDIDKDLKSYFKR